MAKPPMEMLREWDRVMNDAEGLSYRELLRLRKRIIREEYEELSQEFDKAFKGKGNLEAFLKEICDLLYVLYGTCTVLGLDAELGLQAVHESNMSKMGPNGRPIRRQDGKILKGPHYRPPDMSVAANTPIDTEAEEIQHAET